MTIEEKWASLSPRERDAWVAEKVMGHKAFKDRATGLYCEEVKIDGFLHKGIDARRKLPNYSTDIAAAWPIAEEFKLALIPSKNGWSAGPAEGEIPLDVIDVDPAYLNAGSAFWAWASNAPEAICLAALKAVT